MRPDTRDRDDGEFFGVSAGVVHVRYQGRVTVGSPGRAHLRDRDAGISDLIWDALAQAGWLGHTSGIQPTIEVCIRVAPAPTSREPATPHTAPRPGGRRREGERGRIRDDGAAYQRYEGPLHARAVPGIGLIDSERRADDFDYLEDMLYSAALRAGWLSGDAQKQTVAEVPDVDILIGITRRPS